MGVERREHREAAEPSTCTAFAGSRRIASGSLPAVAARVKALADRDRTARILVFDDRTSEPIDLDLRGSVKDVVARIAARAQRSAAGTEAEAARVRSGPGRPRLGVVAREVTLLPRHWAWLNEQPGGASVTLRKLVDHARAASAGRDRQRRAQDAAYRFMTAMAGDEPGFEEATRALFAASADRFDACTEKWPRDVRAHARRLAADAFGAPAGDGG